MYLISLQLSEEPKRYFNGFRVRGTKLTPIFDVREDGSCFMCVFFEREEADRTLEHVHFHDPEAVIEEISQCS